MNYNYAFSRFSPFSRLFTCETCESSLQKRLSSPLRIFPSLQCSHVSPIFSHVWQSYASLQKQRGHVCSLPTEHESIHHLFCKQFGATLGRENQLIFHKRVRVSYICHQGVFYNFRAFYLFVYKKE
jgi:hypothetical protein